VDAQGNPAQCLLDPVGLGQHVEEVAAGAE
jgi:hypothetical protein